MLVLCDTAISPPLVGVMFTGLKDFPGDTIGGLLKLKMEPPGPVGVVGRGPGDAIFERKNKLVETCGTGFFFFISSCKGQLQVQAPVPCTPSSPGPHIFGSGKHRGPS